MQTQSVAQPELYKEKTKLDLILQINLIEFALNDFLLKIFLSVQLGSPPILNPECATEPNQSSRDSRTWNAGNGSKWIGNANPGSELSSDGAISVEDERFHRRAKDKRAGKRNRSLAASGRCGDEGGREARGGIEGVASEMHFVD